MLFRSTEIGPSRNGRLKDLGVKRRETKASTDVIVSQPFYILDFERWGEKRLAERNKNR